MGLCSRPNTKNNGYKIPWDCYDADGVGMRNVDPINDRGPHLGLCPPSFPLITVESGKYTDTLPPVETHKNEQIQIQMYFKVGQQRG